MHGASKQFRQRFASATAACAANGGCKSPNRAAISALPGISGRLATALHLPSLGFHSLLPSLCLLRLHQIPIHSRPPIPEKLPRLPHLGNLVQIQIRRQHFIPIARSLRENLSSRIAEITLSVKLANVPRSLRPHAINRPNKISIGRRV